MNPRGSIGPETSMIDGADSTMLPVPAIVYASALLNRSDPSVTPLLRVIVAGVVSAPKLAVPPASGYAGLLSQFAPTVHVPLPGLIQLPLICPRPSDGVAAIAARHVIWTARDRFSMQKLPFPSAPNGESVR